MLEAIVEWLSTRDVVAATAGFCVSFLVTMYFILSRYNMRIAQLEDCFHRSSNITQVLVGKLSAHIDQSNKNTEVMDARLDDQEKGMCQLLRTTQDLVNEQTLAKGSLQLLLDDREARLRHEANPDYHEWPA